MTQDCRVAVLATHPIHYQVSLFRRLGQRPGIEVTMLFGSRFGLGRHVDHTMGRAHEWYSEDLLAGCHHRFLSRSARSPGCALGSARPAVIQALRGGRYDVLLVQGYAGVTEWLAVAAARAQGCRVLFRGETDRERPSTQPRAAVRGAAMRLLRVAVRVFLPIGTRSRAFYLHHGVPEDRLILSPYAVDNEVLIREAARLSGRRPELREQLGLPADLPVILFVGKLTARKRPLDLVRAVSELEVPASLVVAGDGPLRSSIEALVTKRRLRHVVLTGFRRPIELGPLYAAADVFVLPSEHEPWGLVVNEAMCFGLPVITTSGVAASADLVEPGRNGFVLRPGDVDGLRAALRGLLADNVARAGMGTRSQRTVARWSQAAAVEGIVRAIEMALA